VGFEDATTRLRKKVESLKERKVEKTEESACGYGDGMLDRFFLGAPSSLLRSTLVQRRLLLLLLLCRVLVLL
jgi:hypothetical protein